MSRRRAAAAADDVEQAIAREGFHLGGHLLGCFVILAELVRQTGIRIGADKGIGNARELVDMGAHGIGAERAIEPDGERIGMANGMPEGGRRLAGKRAARKVGDRA
ncbi:hypothetical protein D9M72_360240 [compost metagenome]